MHQCSQQDCLQQPRHRSNLTVHQQVNGKKRCGPYTQWNITQSLEQNHAICSNMTDLEIIILSELSQIKKYHRVSFT